MSKIDNDNGNSYDIEKIFKLHIKNEIEHSKIQLEFLDESIKYYQWCIQHLKNNKPIFLFKNKIKKYNNKLEQYENRIEKLYIEMEEEMKIISKLYEQL